MTDSLYTRLERAVRERIGEGAFLRLSRDESALFASDFPKRFSAFETEKIVKALENTGWKTVLKDGLCFLTPSDTLCEKLRPGETLPDAPWQRSTSFAALIRQYETNGETDARFLLCLLRAVGRARLQDPGAFRDAKAAYAQALADGRSARTALSAALAQELGEITAGGNGI